MPLTGLLPTDPPTPPPRRPERTIAIAALAVVLLHQPFLGIFDKGPNTTVFGTPILFLYLFFIWAVLIALTAAVMETHVPVEDQADEPMTPPQAEPVADGTGAAASNNI